MSFLINVTVDIFGLIVEIKNGSTKVGKLGDMIEYIPTEKPLPESIRKEVTRLRNSEAVKFLVGPRTFAMMIAERMINPLEIIPQNDEYESLIVGVRIDYVKPYTFECITDETFKSVYEGPFSLVVPILADGTRADKGYY